MMLHMLKTKIHRATVTEACLDYEGSISIAPPLIAAAGLQVHEKVLVANITNGNRFETYVIEGKPGEICLNGAAAHLGKPGDKVIIMAWALFDEAEAKTHAPRIIHVDGENRQI